MIHTILIAEEGSICDRNALPSGVTVIEFKPGTPAPLVVKVDPWNALDDEAVCELLPEATADA